MTRFSTTLGLVFAGILALASLVSADCSVVSTSGKKYDMSSIASTYLQGKVTSSASTMTFTACRAVDKTQQCAEQKSAFCLTMSGLYMDVGGVWESQDDLDSVVDVENGVKISVENLVDENNTPVRTELTITCSETETVPITSKTIKPDQLLFAISLDHPAGCASGSSSGGGGGGLSGGWIFIIILLSAVALYVILGCVINIAVRKRSFGRDSCPNAAFWAACPGLVKDGCMWTVGKLRCGKGHKAETGDAGSPSDYGAL